MIFLCSECSATTHTFATFFPVASCDKIFNVHQDATQSSIARFSATDKKPDTPDGWEVSYAGVVRSVFASVLRKSTRFLKTGFKVRPRSFAHSTDRLKELVEFREHYFEGQDHSSRGPTQHHPGRLKYLAKEVFPGFLKHVIAVTIVFSTYENLHDSDYLYEHEYDGVTVVNFLNPLVCGGIAGAMGGLSHRFSDFMIEKILKSPHIQSELIKPTSRSLALSSSALFSSYEGMKWICLNSRIYKKICRVFEKLPTLLILLEQHGDAPVSHPSQASTREQQSHSSIFSSKNSPLKLGTVHSSVGADMFCIALCGSFAGVTSDCVQRFHRYYQLRQLLEERKVMNDAFEKLLANTAGQPRIISLLRYWRHLLLPSSASLVNSALPMALAFIAYEYGKEVVHESRRS